MSTCHALHKSRRSPAPVPPRATTSYVLPLTSPFNRTVMYGRSVSPSKKIGMSASNSPGQSGQKDIFTVRASPGSNSPLSGDIVKVGLLAADTTLAVVMVLPLVPGLLDPPAIIPGNIPDVSASQLEGRRRRRAKKKKKESEGSVSGELAVKTQVAKDR